MTPGALDGILTGFFNAVFSQNGAVTGLLMLIVGYLVRELKNERTAHDATTRQLVLFSENAAKTGVELAETMRSLKSIIDKLVDRLDRGRNA